VILLALVAQVSSGADAAEVGTSSSAELDPLFRAGDPAPSLWNPTGSIVLGGGVGGTAGRSGTHFVLGASFGYAVISGVVPGARGAIIAGDGFGAELAATLMVTPPLPWAVVPFAAGEAGFRWNRDDRGPFYGGGGGLLIGAPEVRVGIQLGWTFRRYHRQDGAVVSHGPIVGLATSW
jgi:hypothetical protein